MPSPTSVPGTGVPRPTAVPGSDAAAALDAHRRLFGGNAAVGEEEARIETLAELLVARQVEGAAVVAAVRAGRAQLSTTELGRWFAATRRQRLARRALLAAPSLGGVLPRSPSVVAALVDAAFWRGVRAAASVAEWRRWTATSYTVLLLHRIADAPPGPEERLCISEAQLARLLRVLRLARFRLLGGDDVVGLHAGSGALQRRSVLLTADDAFEDAVDALVRARATGSIVFVPTGLVDEHLPWSAAGVVAGWDRLGRLGPAGLHVGSHTATHAVLPSLADDDLERELAGSRAELAGRLEGSLPVLAYPHGRHDARVRERARAAGYAAAFTTEPGRNGVGTDPFHLRRVGIKEWDGALALAWKAATGEPVPTWWERWDIRRERRRRRR